MAGKGQNKKVKEDRPEDTGLQTQIAFFVKSAGGEDMMAGRRFEGADHPGSLEAIHHGRTSKNGGDGPVAEEAGKQLEVLVDSTIAGTVLPVKEEVLGGQGRGFGVKRKRKRYLQIDQQ